MNTNVNQLFGTPRSLQPIPKSGGISTGQVVLIIAVIGVSTVIIAATIYSGHKKIIAEMNKHTNEKITI